MTTAGRIRVDVIRCVNCRGDHLSLDFHRRTKLLQIGDVLSRYWSLCPETNKVINLSLTESFDRVAETEGPAS